MATTLGEQVQALSQMYLFRTVPPKYLKAFVKQVKLRRYEEGQEVFLQGDPADRAMLVVEGRLVSIVGDKPVGEISVGEVVGETALFVRGGQRNATVRAKEPTRCLVITRELLAGSADNPAVVAIERHLLGSLARRIRSTNLNIQRVWKDLASEAPAASAAAAAPTIRDRLRGLFGRSS